MIRKSTKFIAALACAFIAGPTAASAEDFNIEVPIDFSALPPNIVSFNVDCLVRTSDDDRAEAVGNGGVREVPIIGGRHTEPVLVRFNIPAGRDPREARFYRCNLGLVSRDRRLYNASEVRLGRAFPLGGPATVSVSGAIPR